MVYVRRTFEISSQFPLSQAPGPVRGERAQRSLGTLDFGRWPCPFLTKASVRRWKSLFFCGTGQAVTSGDAGGDAGGTAASPSPACSAVTAGSGAGAEAASPTRQGDRGKSSGAAGGWPRSGPRLGPLPRPGLTARLFPALASGNLDKQTAKGSTALHYCCLTDNAECLKLLLRGKASIEIGERHRPAPGRRRAEAAALSRRRAPPAPPRVPQGAGSALQRRRPFGRRRHRGHRVGTGAGPCPAALTEAVDLPQVGGRALLSLTHTPDQPGGWCAAEDAVHCACLHQGP